MKEFIKEIKDKSNLGVFTKHEQIIEGTISAISNRYLKVGDILPSVNTLIKELSFSRMTIVKAYQVLKERGIIESKNRLAYFVANDSVKQTEKVLLFLSAFQQYQQVLYNSIMENIDTESVMIDVYFHHYNPFIFKSVINTSIGKYSKYLITPFKNKIVEKKLTKINDEKLLLIARNDYISASRNYVAQDFYNNLLTALDKLSENLKKYKKFILIFDPANCHPEEIMDAFLKINNKHNIEFEILKQPEDIKLGNAYFVIDDDHLFKILKQVKTNNLTLGKDIGILSYNETPMKELIRDGITVVSTDFIEMGKLAAQFIKSKRQIREMLPTRIEFRNSL